MNSLGDVIDRLLDGSRVQLHKEEELMKRQSDLVADMASRETARLKEHNVELSKLLELERNNSQIARDGLIKQISSLLVGYAEGRDKELREIASGVQRNNVKLSASLGAFRGEHDSTAGDAVAIRQTWSESLDNAGSCSSEARQSVVEVRRNSICEALYLLLCRLFIPLAPL